MDRDSLNTIRLFCCAILVIVFLYFVKSFTYKEEKQKEIKTPQISKETYREEYVKCSNIFKTMSFSEATTCFKNLDDKFSTPETKYMIGISLYGEKEYKEAVKYIERVIGDDNADEALKQKAKKILAEAINHINQLESFERNDIGDYFGDLNQIATWRHPNKIKVFVAPDNSKGGAIRLAFMKWDEELRSLVDFIYVDSEENADITAKAVDIKELPQGMAGETGMLYQYYLNDKNKLFMQKAKIRVSYNNPMGANWTSDEFMGITLHEIGHALGILEHSSHRGDIMYYDVSTYRKGTISNRDVNTIKKIYGNI